MFRSNQIGVRKLIPGTLKKVVLTKIRNPVRISGKILAMHVCANRWL